MTSLEVIGWALIHSLWQGTAAAAFALAGLASWRRAGPALRCTLGGAALWSAALLPAASFVVWSWFSRADVSLGAGAASGGPKLFLQMVDELAPLAGAVAPWLAVVWLSGVALGMLRLLAGWRRIARRPRAVGDPSPAVRRACRGVPGLHRLRVRMVRGSGSPEVVGLLRPEILVPEKTVGGMSEAELRGLLAHEAAHVRRRDPLANLVHCVLEILLFHHPAAWWLSRLVRNARECRCDDDAVRVCGDAVTYSRALLALAERDGATRLRLSAHGGVLVGRVRRLLARDRAPRRLRALVAAAGLFLLASSTGILAWQCHENHDGNRRLTSVSWMRVFDGRHPVLQVLPEVATPMDSGDGWPAQMAGGCLIVTGAGHRVEIDGSEVRGQRVVRGAESVLVRGTEGRPLWDLAVRLSAAEGGPRLRVRRLGPARARP